MPQVRDQRWSCHSCGQCCRALVGHLTAEECERIDKQDWEQELGTAPYVRVGGKAMLNRRDGACVFLDAENRCRIHAKFGEEAKPFACRIFPFSVRPVSGGWQASFRFDCPSAAESKGQPISQYRAWLTDLVAELDRGSGDIHDAPAMGRGSKASREEAETVAKRYDRWFRQPDTSWHDRLVGAARITATLGGAKLKDVRDRRLAELLDVLFSSPQTVCQPVPSPATDRQRRMLRQLVFAHAEHVTVDQLRAGVISKMKKRWQQLKHAQRFLGGGGEVPAITGFSGTATFESVEAVGPATEASDMVGGLIGRYLQARLRGRSVFGAGYYDWPVFSGVTALLLSVAVIGWLARYSAAVAGRETVSPADVQTAVGVVDRAASRLPALGTAAERARCAYLVHNDGVARLLADFSILGDPS